MKYWKTIETENDVERIITESDNRIQIIFKDSISCGISAFAKEKLFTNSSELAEKADLNYLDLLTYRMVSNYIAGRLKVIHQSPQVIVLHKGNVVYTSTHHSINPEKIIEFITQPQL